MLYEVITVESLRGRIDIDSVPGEGTKITLILPLTLAIINGLLVSIEDDFFVLPLMSVQECVEIKTKQIESRITSYNVCYTKLLRIGIIDRINTMDITCTVRFLPDNRVVHYQQTDIMELDLAYAITIHKSQGSEFEVVIIPVLTQHFKMLFRNLIYTGITRARKLAVFVGTRITSYNVCYTKLLRIGIIQ